MSMTSEIPATAEEDTARDFRVAIVGGGICGLMVAIGLNKHGIKVDLFESAPKYGEVGAGVGLGPNAVRAIQELGILDNILARSDEKLTMRAFDYRFGTGECEHIYSYPGREDDLGLGIHRVQLVDGLAEVLDSSLTTTHFNKRCTSIELSTTSADTNTNTNTSPKPIIHFADGTTHESDVVLGADGIRSTVREAVVGPKRAQESLSYSNTDAYRGLVPMETLRHLGLDPELVEKPTDWVGDGRHIITFPIKDNSVLNIVAFVTDFSIPFGSHRLPSTQPWVTKQHSSSLLSQFSSFGPQAQLILSCIQEPSKWSIHSIYPELSTYVKGRVALLGDAAHASLPHLGAGAGQGIEDALLLSKLLSHPSTNNSNITVVLQAYDHVRVPRATMVQRGSKRAGDITDGHGECGFSAEGVKKDIGLQFDEVWHHDLGADVEKAVEWLREKGVFP